MDRRAIVCLSVVLLPGLAPGAPAADVHAHAASLFEEGRAFARDGRVADACDRFTESFELEPAVGTELNLADCLEHLGHILRAWQLFEAAAKESLRTGDDARVKFASGRADALESQLAEVVVVIEDVDIDGLAITIAGRSIPPAKKVIEHVDPGEVTVVVEAPGYVKIERTVNIARDSVSTLKLPPLERKRTAEPQRQRIWVYVAGTLGVLAIVDLAVAYRFADVAGQDLDKALAQPAGSPQAFEDVNASRDASKYAAWTVVAGVLLAGAAAVVYVVAPVDGVAIAPSASTTGGGVTISGRF